MFCGELANVLRFSEPSLYDNCCQKGASNVNFAKKHIKICAISIFSLILQLNSNTKIQLPTNF